MGIIAQWFNDRVQSKEVDLIVEDTLVRLQKRDGVLDQFYPIKTYNSRNFLGYVMEKIRTLASVVAPGGTIPAKRHGQLRQLTTQLVKLAHSYQYDEETQWQLYEMRQLAQAKGVGVQDFYDEQGNSVPGTNNSLAEYLFGKPEDLVQGIIDTLSFMTWQVVYSGQVSYTDPYSNTFTSLDWRDPLATYNHFPNALTDDPNTNPADPSLVVWTNDQYANGIYTIENDIETFRETNGYEPDAIIMSKNLRTKLMRQEAVIEIAKSVTATPMDQARMSPAVINSIFQNRELPPIITFDEMFEIENVDGTRTKSRFFPTNRYAFLCKDSGERAMGVTIESKQGLNDEPKPGVFVRTYEKSKSPVMDVTEAIATAIPICLNPKKLFSRQVHA